MAQRPQGALITFRTVRILDESPDIIVHVENRLAHWEKPGYEIAHGGHSRLRDMQMTIGTRFERGLVRVVLRLVRDEHVNLVHRNAIVLENRERLITEGFSPLITRNRYDPRCF